MLLSRLNFAEAETANYVEVHHTQNCVKLTEKGEIKHECQRRSEMAGG